MVAYFAPPILAAGPAGASVASGTTANEILGVTITTARHHRYDSAARDDHSDHAAHGY